MALSSTARGDLPVDTSVQDPSALAARAQVRGAGRVGARSDLLGGRHASPTTRASGSELEDFVGMFDSPHFAPRAAATSTTSGTPSPRAAGPLNLTLGQLPRLFGHVALVMAQPADPDTRLGLLSASSADAARVFAPVADSHAEGFTSHGRHLRGVVPHPADAHGQDLEVARPPGVPGIDSFPAQRPFLDRP